MTSCWHSHADAQHDYASSFGDWVGGKVSLDEYLGQFSDLDLIHLARGIGMAPSGVTPGIAGAFGGVSTRLKASGMPLAACADGPSGIRMDNGAMAFSVPNGTALAATFDLELNRELFGYLALELRKNNIESLLGPGMNIHRHPLNGRNFEYFSEDPLLTGLMADAQVSGMLRHRVAGTVKHFALNNQEYRRNDADSIASQRAIREIYLKPFEILVKRGNLRSVMTSYNPINGVWAASNHELNTVILREEWGFDGIVMTDWWAKMNWSPGADGDRKHVGAMIRAQNDLYMVNLDAEANRNGDLAEEEYKEGRFTRADLLRNAKNICRFIRDYHHELHPLELEVLNEPQLEDNVLVRIDAGKVDKHTVLDVAELTGKKGGSIAVAFEAQHYGHYSLKLRFRSETTEVGQMNVTVSLNNIPAQTISLRGAGVFEETVGFHIGQNPNNYIDIYFSEGGLIIEGAELVYES